MLKIESIFFSGILKYAELKEYLLGPLFTVELHDRDRIEGMQKVPLPPTLFGEEPLDEKISNVGVVAGRAAKQIHPVSFLISKALSPSPGLITESFMYIYSMSGFIDKLFFVY